VHNGTRSVKYSVDWQRGQRYVAAKSWKLSSIPPCRVFGGYEGRDGIRRVSAGIFGELSVVDMPVEDQFDDLPGGYETHNLGDSQCGTPENMIYSNQHLYLANVTFSLSL